MPKELIADKAPRYFAIVAGSLEKHARLELESLGATIHTEVPRGLSFTCSSTDLYRIIYSSRLVQRVLYPIISFSCHSIKYLYQQAHKNIPWPDFFSLSESFGIDTNVSNSFTRHSLYAGQVLKDAICDSFRDKFDGNRPSYTNKEPDILFNLHIHDNRATIALDIIGKSLHQRGYRKHSVEAPLQETLAAAIVYLSGYSGETPLHDPMCGSGTILAEALMKICHIPAGYLRDNSRIKHLPGFSEAMWRSVMKAENGRILPLSRGLISGSDMDDRAIDAARMNLLLLPGGENVAFDTQRFQNLLKKEGQTIISNPPYGVRLGDRNQVIRLYNELGDYLKQKCPKSTAYILCGDKELVSEIHLRAHWTKGLANGNIDTKLAKIVMR